MSKKLEKKYNQGKIKQIIQYILLLAKKYPDADPEYINACLIVNMPGYRDKSHCVNCGGDMPEHEEEIEVEESPWYAQMP